MTPPKSSITLASKQRSSRDSNALYHTLLLLVSFSSSNCCWLGRPRLQPRSIIRPVKVHAYERKIYIQPEYMNPPQQPCRFFKRIICPSAVRPGKASMCISSSICHLCSFNTIVGTTILQGHHEYNSF